MTRPVNRITSVVIAVGLSCLSSSFARGQNAANIPALASYDWSVNSAHSLESNPPTKDVVEAFLNAASGNDVGHVCEFRFADLRRSGNLSLIVSIYGGGTGGCNSTAIFDKTLSGFK